MKDEDGQFLGLGGGTGHVSNVAHEFDVMLNPPAQGSDMQQAICRRLRRRPQQVIERVQFRKWTNRPGRCFRLHADFYL